MDGKECKGLDRSRRVSEKQKH